MAKPLYLAFFWAKPWLEQRFDQDTFEGLLGQVLNRKGWRGLIRWDGDEDGGLVLGLLLSRGEITRDEVMALQAGRLAAVPLVKHPPEFREVLSCLRELGQLIGCEDWFEEPN